MKIFKSPIFWIIVAVILIYLYSTGWFSFLTRKSDLQTPPTNITGGTTKMALGGIIAPETITIPSNLLNSRNVNTCYTYMGYDYTTGAIPVGNGVYGPITVHRKGKSPSTRPPGYVCLPIPEGIIIKENKTA